MTPSGPRVHPGRVRVLRPCLGEPFGPVACWMSRDQRADDNWALLHAQDLALAARVPLVVLFCLAKSYPHASCRTHDFLLRGLRETAAALREKRIGFLLLFGDPAEEVPAALDGLSASVLVADFDPLRHKRAWLRAVTDRVRLPVFEVDAHNVVPCRAVSDKREYAARTLRPKIGRLLDDYLEDFPELLPHPVPPPDLPEPDFLRAMDFPVLDRDVPPAPGIVPGPAAAMARLAAFLREGLPRYAEQAADPNAGAVSGLSPYLHFGQLSAQRAAFAVRAAAAPAEAKAAFLEQLIVRRELSDNFCLRCPDYDRLEGAPAWALETLSRHRPDPRAFLYSPEEFEAGRTHSPLWNAAQARLSREGALHGYLRMFWAKKVLEWSATPEEALATVLGLNDRYALDGRDPNGYVGALWSVAGLHDRPWSERAVFGTVRYMNENGCRRKFDVDRYVRESGAG